LKAIVDSDHKDHASVYFASRSGVFRSSPGSRNNFYSNGQCDAYDPRLRPWYSQSVYGNKNSILLIGNRNSLGASKLSVAKYAAKALIRTSYPQDMFGILTFTATAQPLMTGVNDLVNIDANMANDSSITYRNFLLNKLDNLALDATDGNNY
jgi:hypothetical protein